MVVLYIGTLFDFSGLDTYLEQFSHVVAKVPKAKLVIVGGGSLFASLKKRISELDLSESVIMTGFKPFDMMPQFINMANICLIPFKVNGVTRDIVPGKILQYLACGKPVLATPLPGMVSLLKGQMHGIVYSEIDEFAENTIKLLEDKEMALRLGKTGYQFVKDNHDEIKLGRKLEKILYQQIANSSANTS
jgi:glycosyltransferase involved in cell wall biosynthesis